VTIILQCALNTQTALTIAVRYAAVRRQFGPPDRPGQELPIIEYETHQWRLLPYVAASLIWQHFYNTFYLEYINFFITSSVAYGTTDLTDDDEQAQLGAEIHCLSCAGKAVSAWIARDAIQESREACGGHGSVRFFA
jgi:acyl-CoA oxidase